MDAWNTEKMFKHISTWRKLFQLFWTNKTVKRRPFNNTKVTVQKCPFYYKGQRGVGRTCLKTTMLCIVLKGSKRHKITTKSWLSVTNNVELLINIWMSSSLCWNENVEQSSSLAVSVFPQDMKTTKLICSVWEAYSWFKAGRHYSMRCKSGRDWIFGRKQNRLVSPATHK